MKEAGFQKGRMDLCPLCGNPPNQCTDPELHNQLQYQWEEEKDVKPRDFRAEQKVLKKRKAS